MKLAFLTIALVSFITSAQAGTVCGASYSVGLGHVLKGETLQFGPTEEFAVGKTVKDEFHSLKVTSKNGKLSISLKNNQNVAVEVKNAEFPGANLTVVASDVLAVHPQNVPGYPIRDKVFLFVICRDAGEI